MLSAERVSHAYGSVRALDGVTVRLAAGRTLAVFGPNGAGKSTLLKVLAGLIRPASGTVTIAGGRRAVGWIGHQSLLYAHLTVRENLMFWSDLYDVPRGERARRIDALAAALDLGAQLGRRVATLSRGQVQRAAVARALVHEPRVLLLDEPFTGLDRVGAAELTAILARAAGEGRATVLVTHDVEEGVALAHEIAFLRAGRLVAHEAKGPRTAADVAEAYRRAMTDA